LTVAGGVAGRGRESRRLTDAYKGVREVVAVVHGAGIGRKVAMIRPCGVVKG
jgi:tRNA-splicing ligase RtcB